MSNILFLIVVDIDNGKTQSILNFSQVPDWFYCCGQRGSVSTTFILIFNLKKAIYSFSHCLKFFCFGKYILINTHIFFQILPPSLISMKACNIFSQSFYNIGRLINYCSQELSNCSFIVLEELIWPLKTFYWLC